MEFAILFAQKLADNSVKFFQDILSDPTVNESYKTVAREKLIENGVVVETTPVGLRQNSINRLMWENRYAELIERLEETYDNLKISPFSVRKDIISTLFRLKNLEFQQKNYNVFVNTLNFFYESNKISTAWGWILDALDFTEYQPVIDLLNDYMSKWVFKPQFFHNILPN